MRFSEYLAYFEAAATSNKLIGHTSENKRFFSITIDELLNVQKAKSSEISLYLLPPQIKPTDALSDNVRKVFIGEFLILKNTNAKDLSTIGAVLDETQDVAEQIIAKMKNDQSKFLMNKNHPWKIKGLDLNTVSITMNGPLMGACYGWGVDFQMNQTWTDKMLINNADWHNDTRFEI